MSYAGIRTCHDFRDKNQRVLDFMTAITGAIQLYRKNKEVGYAPSCKSPVKTIRLFWKKLIAPTCSNTRPSKDCRFPGRKASRA
jgi:hypothetical protein